MASDPTLREARAAYFAANGFGVDGGYSARWVSLRAGPLRLGFPNLPARVRAVRFHDLHHVIAGYATDWRGEAEIAAWEIGGSCRDFWAAWLLNLSALPLGLVLCPRRAFAAFLRGRRSANLYACGHWDEQLLERRVSQARRELALDRPAGPASLRDRLAFAGWAALGSGLGLLQLALLLAPLGVAGLWLLR